MKAFPHEEWLKSTDPHVVNPVRHPGMDLRDYFAAKAMQGFLSNAYFAKHDPMDRDYMSTLSYKLADAMMEYRN